MTQNTFLKRLYLNYPLCESVAFFTHLLYLCCKVMGLNLFHVARERKQQKPSLLWPWD